MTIVLHDTFSGSGTLIAHFLDVPPGPVNGFGGWECSTSGATVSGGLVTATTGVFATYRGTISTSGDVAFHLKFNAPNPANTPAFGRYLELGAPGFGPPFFALATSGGVLQIQLLGGANIPVTLTLGASYTADALISATTASVTFGVHSANGTIAALSAPWKPGFMISNAGVAIDELMVESTAVPYLWTDFINTYEVP